MSEPFVDGDRAMHGDIHTVLGLIHTRRTRCPPPTLRTTGRQLTELDQLAACAVVVGGIAGAWTAYRLAHRGAGLEIFSQLLTGR